VSDIEPEVDEPSSANDGEKIKCVRAAEERKGGPQLPSPASHRAFYSSKRPDDGNPGDDEADESADHVGQAGRQAGKQVAYMFIRGAL
jgi:hypothetical protein